MINDFIKQKQHKRRPLAGLIVFIVGCIVSSMLTTQIIAPKLAYSVDLLTSPWFYLGETPIYNPFMWIAWAIRYSNLAIYPDAAAVIEQYLPLALVFFACFGGVAVWLMRQTGVQGLHGTARFANFNEIKKSSLFGGEGVYIGGFLKGKTVHYLRDNGPDHIFAFAPTRSGKDVGLAIPTMLSWLQSSIVLDIKRELYQFTAGWRKHEANNRIIRFDPTTEHSDRYNPLSFIRWGTLHDVTDVQNLVKIIMNPDGTAKQDFWNRSAYDFLVGVILHLGYTAINEDREPALPHINDFLDNPALDINQTLQIMKDTEHNPDGRYDALNWSIMGTPTTTHPAVSTAAQSMLNLDDEPMSSVIQTAKSFFSLYKNPIIAKNITTSDFHLDDIMNGDQPLTLYMLLPPSEQENIYPLIRILITQIFNHYMSDVDFENAKINQAYKYRCLFMLNEFTSLGKLDVLERNIAYVGGIGMKMYLICQNVKQLHKAYTRDESLTGNCRITLAYAPAPTDIETANLLSNMTGKTTVIKKQKTYQQRGVVLKQSTASVAMQEVQRPLLTPDECLRLPAPEKDAQGRILKPGDMLVFMAGVNPIYGKQILFFQDEEFIRRAGVKELLDKATQPHPTRNAASFFTTADKSGDKGGNGRSREKYSVVPPVYSSKFKNDDSDDNYVAPPGG